MPRKILRDAVFNVVRAASLFIISKARAAPRRWREAPNPKRVIKFFLRSDFWRKGREWIEAHLPSAQ
jgi:hypothetical protein